MKEDRRRGLKARRRSNGGSAFGAAAPMLSGMRGRGTRAQPIQLGVQSDGSGRVALARDADNQAIQSAHTIRWDLAETMCGAEAQQMINAGRAGGELRNIDTMGGGESVRGLARSAANKPPQAREILNQMTDERFTGQATDSRLHPHGIGLRFQETQKSPERH